MGKFSGLSSGNAEAAERRDRSDLDACSVRSLGDSVEPRPDRRLLRRILVRAICPRPRGVTDFRFGDGLNGRRQIASTATVRPQLRQRAVRVDHGHKVRPSRPDEPRDQRFVVSNSAVDRLRCSP